MPRGTFPDCCCQCLHPCGEPLQTQSSIGDPPTQVVLVQFPMESLLLSSESWCTQGFVCALQDWSLCFPQSCGSSIIKSFWPSRSDSLGIPSPVVITPGWKPGVGFRIFTTVGELLWYYCFPVCGSPTWQVWDLFLP